MATIPRNGTRGRIWTAADFEGKFRGTLITRFAGRISEPIVFITADYFKYTKNSEKRHILNRLAATPELVDILQNKVIDLRAHHCGLGPAWEDLIFTTSGFQARYKDRYSIVIQTGRIGPQIPDAEEAALVTVNSGGRFQCPHCKRTFYYPRRLGHHLDNDHKDGLTSRMVFDALYAGGSRCSARKAALTIFARSAEGGVA